MKLRVWLTAVVALLGVAIAGHASGAIIEGYPTDNSVAPGDLLELHVRCTAARYTVSIWKMKTAPLKIADLGTFQGHNYALPASSWELGCNWPVTCQVQVPADWVPGAYLARIDAGAQFYWIPFVVRAAVPGSVAGVVVQLSTNTYQAYNRYGGKSLYGAWQPGLTGRASKVSFQRPYNFLATDGSGQFFVWDGPFIAFLEREGISYEVITNYDLHRFPGILSSYRMFCSIGHDEYWSKEMYDEVERFANAGGNLAFFSGNVLWWQVRFEDAGRTMVCYKDALLDPMAGVHDELVTVNWQAPPVNRPPARLVGTHYNGSWGVPLGAYRVFDRSHWAFQGVTVDSGQAFGYPMVGYEIDARNRFSPPVDVIARVELADVNNGNRLRPAEMTYYERTAEYGFPGGRGAKIFAGSSVNWVQGIQGGYNIATRALGTVDPIARAVTVNVFDRLGCAVSTPRLANPAPGAIVSTPRTLVAWFPVQTHRCGACVEYTLYWREQAAAAESLVTSQTAAWLAVKEGRTYRWRVRATVECGSSSESPENTFAATRPTDTETANQPPRLSATRDGAQMEIRLALPAAATAALDIYSASGQCIRSFGSLLYPAGTTSVSWDLRGLRGERVASGLYFVRVRLANEDLQTKVVLLR